MTARTVPNTERSLDPALPKRRSSRARAQPRPAPAPAAQPASASEHHAAVRAERRRVVEVRRIETLQYASVWRRMIAIGLDSMIQFAILLTLVLNVGPAEMRGMPVLGTWGLWCVVVCVPYVVLQEWLFGQTLGKRALGIHVATLNGGRPRLHQIVARDLGLMVDLILFGAVGLLLILLGRRRHRLGDIAARTVVLRVENRPLLSTLSHLLRHSGRARKAARPARDRRPVRVRPR